jgi:hypothetical protein
VTPGRYKKARPHPGTGSSNPPPSSRESANHRFRGARTQSGQRLCTIRAAPDALRRKADGRARERRGGAGADRGDRRTCQHRPYLVTSRQTPAPLWGGIAMKAGQMMTLGSGNRVHTRTSGPTRWHVIRLPKNDLLCYGRALCEASFIVPRPCPLASLARNRAEPRRAASSCHQYG